MTYRRIPAAPASSSRSRRPRGQSRPRRGGAPPQPPRTWQVLVPSSPGGRTRFPWKPRPWRRIAGAGVSAAAAARWEQENLPDGGRGCDFLKLSRSPRAGGWGGEEPGGRCARTPPAQSGCAPTWADAEAPARPSAQHPSVRPSVRRARAHGDGHAEDGHPEACESHGAASHTATAPRRSGPRGTGFVAAVRSP